MPNQDYAWLVGIQHYGYKAFPGLSGPLRDVELMKGWLVSPDGGNLDADNVMTVLSPATRPDVPLQQMLPSSFEFENRFEGFVFDANGVPIPRRDSRLYLYFSGHGFSQIRDQMPRACLYTANARQSYHDNIAGTFFAYWAKAAALFRDIVIVMDCCRDAEFARDERKPPFPPIENIGAAAKVDVFGIYAAPKGGKAQERPIPSRGNQVYSLLTHALIEAMETALPNKDGAVTSDAVAAYIRERWNAICAGVPADPPEFAFPTRGPIDIFTRGGSLISQRLDTGAWPAGESVDLSDGRLAPLARLTRSIDGSTVTVAWTSRQPETVTVRDGAIPIALKAGLYRVRRGEAVTCFQAGDEHVSA